MNVQSNITEATSEATELAVDRVNRLAKELAHAMDDWHEDTNTEFVAHVYAASSGKGIWFQNVNTVPSRTPIDIGDVIDTLREAHDLSEAVFMAAGHLPKDEAAAIQCVTTEAQNRIQKASEALYEIRGTAA